jgi:hypothetical protein
MKQVLTIVVLGVFAAGCAQISVDNQPVGPGSGQMRPVARPDGARAAAKPPGTARTVEQFDTTSAEEKKAAEMAAREAAKSGEGRLLGRTIASLGDPTDPGIWLRTPLVSTPSKGRVVYPVNGRAVQVDLIPIDGPKTAGSRMSLAALRVIEAPLTGLPEVEVYTE